MIKHDFGNTGEEHSGNLDRNGRLMVGWGQIREGMIVKESGADFNGSWKSLKNSE